MQTAKLNYEFSEVLLVLQILPDFEEFGMRLLFQQLADPSGKIIRNAVRILNKWLPVAYNNVYINCNDVLEVSKKLEALEKCPIGDVGRRRNTPGNLLVHK
jgi:hypothetical protein